jgi:hypothetical protein
MIRDNTQFLTVFFVFHGLPPAGQSCSTTNCFFFRQPYLSCILLLASESISFPMCSVMIVLESHITNLNGSLADVCEFVQSIIQSLLKSLICALTNHTIMYRDTDSCLLHNFLASESILTDTSEHLPSSYMASSSSHSIQNVKGKRLHPTQCYPYQNPRSGSTRIF